MSDPRCTYWFEPPFRAEKNPIANSELHEILIVDAEGRCVQEFHKVTQWSPGSPDHAPHIAEEENRWFEFAQWLAERMNA